MRRKKEEAEVTRKQLLDAALRVFSEKGFAATRLSDIAAEANVTRGAIYWHFGNKRELFVALFKERVDPFFNTIKQILDEELGPLDKLKKILTVFFDKLQCDQDFMANQNLDFMEMKIRNEIPEIKEYMHSRGDKFYIMLVKIIIAGMERGEIRKDLDPDAITSMLATLIMGYGFLSTREEHQRIFKGRGNEIIDIFLKGIAST